MTNDIFNIFGSSSSKDFDIMIFVKSDVFPELIKDRFHYCSVCESKIEEFFKEMQIPMKQLNCNLAVCEDGIITKVHKGTIDEVNNSIFLTYDLHRQFYPLQITKLVERDIDLKLLRATRIILSFLSRTKYREVIKRGLAGDLNAKFYALEMVDFTQISELGSKHTEISDAMKSIAFQYGQIIGLLQGKELYSKEDISFNFPELSLFLRREQYDISILNYYKEILIEQGRKRIPHMTTLYEDVRR